MRFVIRAIIFGILTGAFLFFFPFHFFFFPVLFTFLLIRLFFRPWRWRHRYYGFGPGGCGHPFSDGGPMNSDDRFAPVMPIDGYRFDRPRQGNGSTPDRNIQIQ